MLFRSTLDNWDMPQIERDWGTILQNQNPLILEQRNYDAVKQAELAEECINSLNPNQRSAFEKIIAAITNSTEETFFPHGAGGTGKTYVVTVRRDTSL